MGRFLLILVASVSLTGAYFALSSAGAESDRSARQASAEEMALARQAAQAGFDDALHQVDASADAEPWARGRAMGAAAGTYDLDTELTPYGARGVTSRGHFGAAEYVVQGEILPLLRTGGAVTVHASELEGDLDAGTVIDGSDHRVPGAPHPAGPAGSNPAVVFSDPAVRAAAEAEWGPSPPLVGGVANGPSAETLAALQALAEALVEEPATLRMDKLELKNDAIGSPTAPVVVHVTDKAKLEQGAVGYGVLILDGDLEMKKDARWEGLVIIRADAGSGRSIKLKDQAEIVGSLVLLGTEYLEESDGESGFVGGHMDLDLFEGAGAPLDRAYHQHEWDDKYDLTYIDFFNGPDIGPEFSAFAAGHGMGSLRVQFVNAGNSSGTYTIGAHTGRLETGFDAVVPVASLSPFVVAFDALCTLRGTSPGRVKSAGGDRDGAFTVRFFDGAQLVYAVSAYEHAKELRDGGPSCTETGDGESSESSEETYGEFKLELSDEAAIRYSEEAAGRAASASQAVRDVARSYPVLIRSVPTSLTAHDDSAGPGPGVDPDPGPDPDGDGRVTICHKPGTKNAKTKSVDVDSLSSHLGHGDYVGACGAGG